MTLLLVICVSAVQNMRLKKHPAQVIQTPNAVELVNMDYYNAQDASHACHECSHCCSDGKDEIQAECVRHGLEKRHCSLRMDTNCGPTIKPSISSNTGDSGKFRPIYILYICIGALVGVVILLVAVLLKRRNAGQNNLSVDTNPEQGIKQHEAQPMIHINGRADPQLDNSNLTTPTRKNSIATD